MLTNSNEWYQYLISLHVLKYVIAGSIARSFADNKAIGKTGKDFVKFAIANAVLATACSAVVGPLSAELGLSENWQKLLLFFAGYMGLGFLDIIQAKLRYILKDREKSDE
jgi:hypothetical protein